MGKKDTTTLNKIMDEIRQSGVASSPSQMIELIRRLNDLEDEIRRQKEQENDRRQKKIEEEMQAIAKAQAEAHVKEVTSMDLPLDWENAFFDDARTHGVHTESISDGLIMSLNSLG